MIDVQIYIDKLKYLERLIHNKIDGFGWCGCIFNTETRKITELTLEETVNEMFK